MTADCRLACRAAAMLGAIAAALLVALCGCEKEGESDRFTFLVLSDTHVRLPGFPDSIASDSQANRGNFDHMVDRINRDYSGAAFVIVTGDLVGNLYSDDPAAYLAGNANAAEEFVAIMSGLNMPWHATLGNHDYMAGYDTERLAGTTTAAPADMEAVWEKVLGHPSYYSFVFGRWRFVILNSSRGAARSGLNGISLEAAMLRGGFDDTQLAWLENQLQNPEPCLLFLHHPPITDHNEQSSWTFGYSGMQMDTSDRFYEVAQRYQDRIKGLFVGHGHVWTRDTLHGVIPVYETGALGDWPSDKDNVHVVTVAWDNESYTVEIGNSAAAYLSDQ